MVICDTSGRLHTNANLMEELAKCKRAIGKRLPGAPHEVLLVLDGTTGVRACMRVGSCLFGHSRLWLGAHPACLHGSPKDLPLSMMGECSRGLMFSREWYNSLLFGLHMGGLHASCCVHAVCAQQQQCVALKGVLPPAPAGLNMLNQAREFHEMVGLSGLVLTKLDGTARGGAVVSVVDELRLPVKFVGRVLCFRGGLLHGDVSNAYLL